MIEAMKQALEALEYFSDTSNSAMDKAMSEDAITSLRQAIKELESQEPDKYTMDIECTKCGAKQSGVLTVNTHPPQRTWQGLTDDEIASVGYNNHPLDGIRSYARAIEAKLKEKNT